MHVSSYFRTRDHAQRLKALGVVALKALGVVACTKLVLQRASIITRMHLRMRASNDFGIVTTPRVLHVCA